MSRFTVSEGRFGRVLIAFMAFGFFSLVVAGVAAAWITQRAQQHGVWVEHTYQVELGIADVRRRVEQSEGTRRGHLLAPTQAAFLTTWRETLTALPIAVRRLQRLTADNPHQQANIARLTPLLATQLARQRRSFDLLQAGRRDEALRLFAAELPGREMRRIRAGFDAMAAEEHRLLVARDAGQRASLRTFYVIFAIAGALLVLMAAVSLGVVLRFTRDLTASRDAQRLLNDTLEDQVAERTADLTRANEEIQRFAYIVSHDLRSPLVNVMGFTAELEAATGAIRELIDRAETQVPAIVSEDARLAAREDLPEAIGFIRTSTQKMDRLINAILRLSREGRRVITPERLDMTAVARSIRDTVQHRLDAAGAELSIEEPLPPVRSDRLAVEQILSNLVDNAVKYLQPGRPGRIVVRGRAEPTRAVYEVEDNGRGIAAGDRQRVFDLFRRSGTQDQPGEGIGLAHVRALAYRLGGTVDLASELGRGSTFRLILPAEIGDANT